MIAPNRIMAQRRCRWPRLLLQVDRPPLILTGPTKTGSDFLSAQVKNRSIDNVVEDVLLSYLHTMGNTP